MKILVAGDWHSELHEEAVYRAFRELGHEVLRFEWHTYFEPTSTLGRALRPFLKAQNKYQMGPRVNFLNSRLIAMVAAQQPDIVFIYRGTHILPRTLKKIRECTPHVRLLSYNNDDPFSPHYSKWMWRNHLHGISEYDLVLSYRHQNIEEYRAAGAKRVDLLRSWYVPMPEVEHRIGNSERSHFISFIGHYENDGRGEAVAALVAAGFDVKVYGPYCGFGEFGWDNAFKRFPILNTLEQPRWLGRNEYAEALLNSDIALCFLSKLNRDTYTRRCFEIPYFGSALLSERTGDLESLYRDGYEAAFFKTIDELLCLAHYYRDNRSRLIDLQVNGRRAVVNGRHDVVSRMQGLLAAL